MRKSLKFDQESHQGEGHKSADCDDILCLYCGEECGARGGGWVQCTECRRWGHEECAGIDDEDEFICELGL